VLADIASVDALIAVAESVMRGSLLAEGLGSVELDIISGPPMREN
jgi:hypothetical protein